MSLLRRYAVAQLVEALRYKLEGNGFEYQEYFLRGKAGRCIGLTTLPPSCADCLEIWEPHPPGNPEGLSRPVVGFLFYGDIVMGGHGARDNYTLC